MPNKVELALTMTKQPQSIVCDVLDWQPSKISKIVRGYIQNISHNDSHALGQFFGCEPRDLFPVHEQERATA